jgi:hypothetical protein
MCCCNLLTKRDLCKCLMQVNYLLTSRRQQMVRTITYLQPDMRFRRRPEEMSWNLVKVSRSSICFFKPCHRVLADLTPGTLVSGSHRVSTLLVCNAISLLSFICLCAFAYNNVEYMGGLESYFTKTICTCLFIWEHVGASVRLLHPRTWFKPQWQIATDRSRTPMVLFFVKCLWCLIWNWYCYKTTLSFSLYVLAAWGGCVFWAWRFLICIFHFFLSNTIQEHLWTSSVYFPRQPKKWVCA